MPTYRYCKRCRVGMRSDETDTADLCPTCEEKREKAEAES